MIRTWLVHSMKPSTGKTYLFLPTAKDIWDVVLETYLNTKNLSNFCDKNPTMPNEIGQLRVDGLLHGDGDFMARTGQTPMKIGFAKKKRFDA